mmetsp:Transcript_5312/g.13845  ORF Transcript_5312/g.13845 Transcript_5312/m.13845 type:complete len:217 (-) Transcript_5312:1351-2001(-)
MDNWIPAYSHNSRDRGRARRRAATDDAHTCIDRSLVTDLPVLYSFTSLLALLLHLCAVGCNRRLVNLALAPEQFEVRVGSLAHSVRFCELLFGSEQLDPTVVESDRLRQLRALPLELCEMDESCLGERVDLRRLLDQRHHLVVRAAPRHRHRARLVDVRGREAIAADADGLVEFREGLGHLPALDEQLAVEVVNLGTFREQLLRLLECLERRLPLS